jgi:hypothetical protein
MRQLGGTGGHCDGRIARIEERPGGRHDAFHCRTCRAAEMNSRRLIILTSGPRHVGFSTEVIKAGNCDHRNGRDAQFALHQFQAVHDRNGSFSTESVGIRIRSMSASLRKRPKCCVAAKRRYVPQADICSAAKSPNGVSTPADLRGADWQAPFPRQLPQFSAVGW